MAPNKMTAKIASDIDKPDGLFVIKPGEVETFINELPVEKILPQILLKLRRTLNKLILNLR